MTDGSSTSAVPAVDDRPIAVPSSGPLGVLSCLPEELLKHLRSFLPGRDVARLGGCCSTLHDSPHGVWPMLKLRLRGGLSAADEADEEAKGRRIRALFMLASRAGVVKELRLEEASAVVPFCSAMHEGGRPLGLLTSLHLLPPYGMTDWRQSDGCAGWPQRLVAEMMSAGQLPELRELQLSRAGLVSFRPVWRALGEGACPKLERISLGKCKPEEVAGLAAALEARPEGCVDLKAVHVNLDNGGEKLGEEKHEYSDAVAALLSCLAPGSLEELDLTIFPVPRFRDSLVHLLTSGCAALKTLRLRFKGVKLRYWEVPDEVGPCDGLLYALAQGAAPSLTSLNLDSSDIFICSDEAWLALGEAMGPEGTCLRRVKTLELSKRVWASGRQLEIFSRAVGAGHGCPELESLSLDLLYVDSGPCGAALAHAFRPPNGLPRLKKLKLDSLNMRDGHLRQLFETLGQRPHAVKPIESIIAVCNPGDWALGLDQGVEWGGLLAGLRELEIALVDTCPHRERDDWNLQLIEALAGEAGQRLEKLALDCMLCSVSMEAPNRFLQALATQGACPKLRSLSISEGPLIEAGSLGEILAGRAACSATLRDVRLADDFCVSSEGARTLAACLRDPGAIQLESLHLRVAGRDSASAASVMELLDALQGRAGSRLRRLNIVLTGCEESDAEGVVDHLVDVIMAGGLPAMGPSDSTDQAAATDEGWRWQDDVMTVSVYKHPFKSVKVGADKVKRAFASRAEAQWLASW